MRTPSLAPVSRLLSYYALRILVQEIARLRTERQRYNKEHQHHDILTVGGEFKLLLHDGKDMVLHRHH